MDFMAWWKGVGVILVVITPLPSLIDAIKENYPLARGIRLSHAVWSSNRLEREMDYFFTYCIKIAACIGG